MASGAIRSFPTTVLLAFLLSVVGVRQTKAGEDGSAEYKTAVAPVLEQFCVRCHDAETKKGNVRFDTDPSALASNKEQWLATLRMLRAGMMPPKGKSRPSAEQVAAIENWIKTSVFKI